LTGIELVKHDWKILEQVNEGGSIPYCGISPKYPKANAIETIYKVQCENCGAEVWTVANRLEDNTVHCDWYMEGDCNLQLIREIHES